MYSHSPTLVNAEPLTEPLQGIPVLSGLALRNRIIIPWTIKGMGLTSLE